MAPLVLADIDEEEEEEAMLTTCAFCLMTSAGVRTAQETISAADEATPWIRGTGRVNAVLGLAVEEDGVSPRMRFTDSYVVKNAPARTRMSVSFYPSGSQS